MQVSLQVTAICAEPSTWPGGMEFDPDVAEPQFLAIRNRLRTAGEVVAIAQPHHVERLLGGEHRAMAGTGVVGMAMGDHGALTGRTGSMWKSPGLQHSPAATGIRMSSTHLRYIGGVAAFFTLPTGRGRRAEA